MVAKCGARQGDRNGEIRSTYLVCLRNADTRLLVLMERLAQEEASYKFHLVFRVLNGLRP
jgi:hypothetical protein